MLAPNVEVRASLNDGEESLIGTSCGLDGNALPRESFAGSHRRIRGSGAFAGRALVEHHGDVGTKILLNRDRTFGGQFEQSAVDVRAECNAGIGHVADLRQAENLKSAGVSQDRPIPAHELVQSAQFGNQLVAGPQGEVIRVAQDDLSPRILRAVPA